MRAVLYGLCQALYAIILLTNLLWATGLAKLISLSPLPRTVTEGCANVLVQAAFRVTSYLSPWMWCTADPKSAAAWSMAQAKMKEVDALAALGKSPYKPLLVLGNHVSFFDTPLGCIFSPSSFTWRARAYVSAGLLKMPLLGTMIRAQGHFTVPFGSHEGGFSVNRDKMAEVQQRAAEHVEAGGWVVMFPEGTVNADPDTLLPFRYGGMKSALEWDARVVTFIGHGSQRVWPKGAKIGGMPGRVRCSARCVAPDGVRKYIGDLRARPDLQLGDRDLPDHQLLAKYLRLAMQCQYDELRAAAAGACCCPCRGEEAGEEVTAAMIPRGAAEAGEGATEAMIPRAEAKPKVILSL